MKKSYFVHGSVWLKGNIHCHSTISDGKLTPDALKDLYAEHGYDFLSLTDHNTMETHKDDKLIMLKGVEHDLSYGSDKCIHVVGLAGPGHIETQYGCRQYSTVECTDQQLIEMMRSDGQFVEIAHPPWSRMEIEELLSLKGFHAIEIFNHGTERLGHNGYAEVYWDIMLQRGKRVYAIAADDVHDTDDLFGGWICAKAQNRSAEAVLDALFKGRFYASTGPVVHDFGLEGQTVYIVSTEQ